MKKRLYLTLCVFLFVLPKLLIGQEAAYDLPIREHVFENGLRLLVLERPNDHRVACKIFTDFGAMVETPGDLGSAHFLEHLMFKGTQTLGTTDWQAEAPLIEKTYATEAELVQEMNLHRNDLRERGVFHDYRHKDSTPRIDSLRHELTRLNQEVAKYRDHGAMMRWYQGFGGAKLTASTEQEYMKFDINLPREKVALFLRMEADRMRNSVFREFDEERMILVEQRYGDLNRPTTPYYEAMNALVQTAHPVYWPEGHLSDFGQYTRSYHRDLYERYFIANNTTLVFVGGVTLDQMRPLVERYFGWMQRRPEPMRVKAVEPIPQAEKRLVWRSRSLKPRVEMRFMIPGIGHPDRPHFDPLAEVARAELQKAYERAELKVEINVNSRVVHTSRFGVPASLNFEAVIPEEGDLDRAENIMSDVLARLGEQPSSAESLHRAKKKLRTEWYRLALDADRLAFEIGHFQVMDNWRTLKSFLETRESSTLGHVQRLATKYFVDENRSVGLVLRPSEQSKGEAGTR